MTTLSTSSLNWLASQWENSYSSAVLSGIVGDLAHKARGGYHISREDQGSSNYSVTRYDDKLGPSDRAAAIDMTMSTADIIKCHKRLRAIWQNRSNDPRMKYINAWNGWDGQGDAGRYDVVTGSVTTATADHKWHIHLEIRRRYVNDMDAMRAILSMLRGEESLTDSGDDDMALSDTDIKKVVDGVWNKALNIETDSSKPDNPQPAGGILRYTSSEHHAILALARQILAKVSVDNVDETAIANALVNNSTFIANLANSVAAKLPSGVQVSPAELTTALKAALREGVASA